MPEMGINKSKLPCICSCFFFFKVDYTRPSSKHRKIATSFRDTTLKDILMLACSLLKEVSIIKFDFSVIIKNILLAFSAEGVL